MTATRKFLLLPALVLPALLGAVVALQASPRAGMAPTVVVTVNISRVFDGLDQRAAAQAALQKLNEEFLQQEEEWKTEIEGLKAELEAAVGGDVTTRRLVEEKAALKALEFQEWQRYRADRRDIEKSLLWRDLYSSVCKSLEALCASQGYDVVLVHDNEQQLVVSPNSPVSSEDQVKQQMTSRQIVYAVPRLDVTEELIDRMNNQF